MPIKITMPALSPTMTEGKLAKWVKGEGDTVSAGDVIAEIETDKATMEVEAVDEGKIAKILVPEGTEGVAVNDVIAVLLEDGEEESEVDSFLKTIANSDTPPSAQTTPVKPQPSATAPATRPDPVTPARQSPGARIKATPLARRIARLRNIDLARIRGSGPYGRIIKADVEAAQSGHLPATATATAAPAATAPKGVDARQLADQLGMTYTAVPNSGVRKVIAKRLLESKQTVPHYYLSIDCVIDPLLETRKQLNTLGEAEGYKVSVNDFIVRAAATALRKVPQVNSAWTDEAVLLFQDTDVSVAVATDNGLITPIVKNADKKSVIDISREVKDLAARARENKLRPEEFQGGTLTVSNLGMYGIKEFIAIINPPQSCILAVGAGEARPIAKNGQIVPATVMTVTGSFDHRSVDGAVGAEFMAAFKDLIENPAGLLING